MPTQTEQINDLITETTALKTTFENKDAAIDASVATVVGDAASITASKTQVDTDAASVAAAKAQTDLDAAAIATAIGNINATIVPKIPYTNLIRDGGRFIGSTNTYQIFEAGGFDASQSSAVIFNGSTIVDGGKFTYDSSSYGGAGAVNPQTVLDLITKMGRSASASRYSPEFFVAKCTAGSGTSVVRSGHYLMLTLDSSQNLSGITNKVSFGCWLRLTNGTGWVGNLGGDLSINGVDTAADREVTVAEGWIHVAGTQQVDTGYLTTMLPAIFGLAGTVFEIALPVIVPADVRVPVHTNAINSQR